MFWTRWNRMKKVGRIYNFKPNTDFLNKLQSHLNYSKGIQIKNPIRHIK